MTGWELGLLAVDLVKWQGPLSECEWIRSCLSGGSFFLMLCASPCWRPQPTLWSLTTCLARSSLLAIQTPIQVIQRWLGISLSQRDFESSFTSCTSTWNPPTFVNTTMWRWDPGDPLPCQVLYRRICWELEEPRWIRCCVFPPGWQSSEGEIQYHNMTNEGCGWYARCSLSRKT